MFLYPFACHFAFLGFKYCLSTDLAIKLALLESYYPMKVHSVWNNVLFSQNKIYLFGIFSKNLTCDWRSPRVYGSKLSGWEICSFCVTFCQFSSWPAVKWTIRGLRKKYPVDKYAKESNRIALFLLQVGSI